MSKKEPLKIYISGGQGSGKTTLSYALKIILENCFDVRVANFSIDDLYLPKSERYRLSKKVHPLLKTRGVPGTHEIQLGIDTINSLVSQKNKETRIPIFSKKYDDRLSKSDWPIFFGTPNSLILNTASGDITLAFALEESSPFPRSCCALIIDRQSLCSFGLYDVYGQWPDFQQLDSTKDHKE